MVEKKGFRVKKPHNKYIDDIISKDITWIRGDRSAGLYISRLAKHNPDLFQIKPESRDNWILWRKNPIRRKFEGVKYQWYGL